jgi:hypothetical protein
MNTKFNQYFLLARTFWVGSHKFGRELDIRWKISSDSAESKHPIWILENHHADSIEKSVEFVILFELEPVHAQEHSVALLSIREYHGQTSKTLTNNFHYH